MRRHLPKNPSEDVSGAVEAFMTSSPELGDDAFDYEVSATLAARTLVIKLTLIKGETYCCKSAECHLGLDEERWDESWERLRVILENEGHTPSRPLSIRAEVVVEQGAKFNASCGPVPKDKCEVAEERAFERNEYVEDRT